MKPLKLLSAMSISIAMLFFSIPALAQAQAIPYTPSFSLPATAASLNALHDNDFTTPGTNGFAASNVKAGTLTFTFAGDWDVSGFTIWNNINGTTGGVENFVLKFFDSGGTSLGTLSRLNVSRNAQPTVISNLTYVGVHRVDMVITNTAHQIEIREIQFEGARTRMPPPPPPPSISTCCPPSSSFALTTMFNSVQANVGANYHLNFTMNPTFEAQMAAYAALLKALDPSVLSTVMAVRAYDGGTAAAPLIGSGAALQWGAVIWAPPANPNASLWPFPAFFTSVADLPPNTWTVVEVSVWIARRPGTLVQVENCPPILFAFRPQIAGPLRRGGPSASGFVPYAGPPPRTEPPRLPPRR